MLHKISLDNKFSGEHFGLVFVNREAHTEDKFLASRLRGKGYHVTAEAVADDEAVSDTGETPEAPPFIDVDEEVFEAAEQLAEAGGFTLFDLERMTVAQLKEYAEAGDVDLGGAKTKADIIAIITAEMLADDVPEAE
ncbi:MAG: hypothetical protein K2H90_03470 [Oscillospiraceae bacterium]|nr:hypothetical protein [Oscillospiraceae bacterium]